MRSQLEKRLQVFTHAAQGLAWSAHKDMMQMVRNGCTRRIVTTGYAERRLNGHCEGKFLPGLYSYCNENHHDDNDMFTPTIIEEYSKFVEKSDYKQKLLDCPRMCLPTTCAYQVNWRPGFDAKGCSLQQHFVMSGLKMAMPLEDCIGHHFYASLYTHHTSVAILWYRDGGASIGSDNPEVLVFAWGSSGKDGNVIAVKKRTAEREARRDERLGEIFDRVFDLNDSDESDDSDEDETPAAVMPVAERGVQTASRPSSSVSLREQRRRLLDKRASKRRAQRKKDDDQNKRR